MLKLQNAKNNIEKEHCKRLKIYIHLHIKTYQREIITASNILFSPIRCVNICKRKRNSDACHVNASNGERLPSSGSY